jgi:hypothetical protein
MGGGGYAFERLNPLLSLVKTIFDGFPYAIYIHT